ncbi:hypothetical protein ALQ39_200150 [Pseudomonas amygdali pv. eriobotryae]|uniref:Uncharacterized protein n=1 Tax=Pseudomonas amygdali pv. eriobotryae TaxID=129137 RepID=A0A3M3X9C5_PSEA0|nr:hypothetical protein ALQ39_200150 [Pseudomonas amygdali pv. eriobotryae]
MEELPAPRRTPPSAWIASPAVFLPVPPCSIVKAVVRPDRETISPLLPLAAAESAPRTPSRVPEVPSTASVEPNWLTSARSASAESLTYPCNGASA